MKSLLSKFFDIIISLGEARHAAWLARQGRISEAKALYMRHI